MSKLSRPKARSRKNLEDLLHRAVSRIVRMRHPFCVVCGSTKELTCGHYIRRGRKNITWDLVNCNTQCSRCNSIHNDDPEPYRRWMIATYGADTLVWLSHMANTPYVLDMWELERKLESFKSMERLMKDRGARLSVADTDIEIDGKMYRVARPRMMLKKGQQNPLDFCR